MKTRFNYKSKKTIIIAIIALALIIISGIAIGMFIKANDTAEAVGGNNTVTDGNNSINQNETVENQTGTTGEQNGETAGNAGEGEDQENPDNEEDANNENNEGNVNNEENAENQEENANNEGNNAGNDAGNNAGNANNNAANVPGTEFIVGRTETIPERVISENYYVSWIPRQFNTTVENELNKSNITAVKTVAKVTGNGILQNAETAKVGDILQYTITLTNNHEKINGVVTVKDIIPWGTEFVSATGDKLKTTPEQYAEAKEVTALTWKNVKVEAGKEVNLVVYVKVLKSVGDETVTVVKNVASVTEGITTEEVESPETKIANITKIKESRVIYNEQKSHEHIVVDGVEPLHEQDIIEYTIRLTNKGAAAGTVEVTDTVPEGSTFVEGSKVIVVDKNGTSEYEMSELVEGIDVTVEAATEVANDVTSETEEVTITKVPGTATVTFRVIVNSFEEETKIIRNDMAKVDGDSTNTTEDEAKKLYIDIPVEKTWENMESDAAQAYKLDIIKFQVKNGESVVAEKMVAAEADKEQDIAGEWKYTFTKLPKYNAEGNEIDYVVEEKAINEEEQEYLDQLYDVKTEVEKSLTTTNVKITNTFVPENVTEQTERTITKIWEDDENNAGERPEEVTIKLNGVDHKLTAKNDEDQETKHVWTLTVNDIPKYDEQGNEIVYTVQEDKVQYYKEPVYGEDGLTVTNPIDYTSIKISKTIVKKWEDDGDKIGERPESVKIKLNGVEYEVKPKEGDSKNTSNEWTLTVNDLLKYDEQGNEIVYTVQEDEVQYYKDPVYGEDGLTVTNAIDYTSVTISKTIVKIWEDDANNAGERPDNIKIKLNGVEHELKPGNDETPNTPNEWTLTVNNLPKYDENGDVINYTVKEDKVEYYNEPEYDVEGDTLTVTNKIDYASIKISKPVKKIWLNDDGYKNKETAVEVRLYAENATVEKKTLELNSTNSWTATFENLNKYTENGTEIKYKVEEITQVPGYTTSYGETGGILTVTNTYNRIQLGTITKNWTGTSQTKVEVPLDVVFVVDTSGSMLYAAKENGNIVKDANGNTVNRAEQMMPAVNKAIGDILNYNNGNNQNRVSVVAFSDYVGKTPGVSLSAYNNTNNANVLLGLSHNYTPKSTMTYGGNRIGNYLTYDSTNDTLNTNVTQKGNSQNKRYFEQATYTQAGIELGAKQLINASGKQVTLADGRKVTRIPVIILVTDGEPTYYHVESRKNDGTLKDATVKGKGQLAAITADFGYNTILTANYFKDKVNAAYGFGNDMKTKMYTIGISVYTQFGETVLDPSKKGTTYTNNGFKDKTQTKALRNKLNSTHAYANKSFSGEMSTADLISAMNQIFTDSIPQTQTWNITTTDIDAGKAYLPDIKINTIKIIQDGVDRTSSYTISDIIKNDYIDLTKLEPCKTISITYTVK